VKERTPEEREEFRQMIERGRAARKKVQEIIDRVEARRIARQKQSS
jgi:hypothetical protein